VQRCPNMILQKYKEAVKAVDGREKRRYDSYNEET
jgi:hypothetical protein